MEQLTSLEASDGNSSSGGAGGNGVLLGTAGGNGGGGGGSVELTAGGDLTIGGIEAKGASGASGTNNGGGGSGGVALVRAGGSVNITGKLDVSGGSGTGIAGALGRARIDATTINAGTTAMFYQGPTFATTTPLIVRSKTASVTVLNEPQRNIQYYINNADGSQSHGPLSILTPQNGMATFPLAEELFKGLNQVCAIVDSANANVAAAGQCIDIVWLP